MTLYPLRRLVAALVVLAVLTAGAFSYASPYLVLNRLKHAADARDGETINQYVDYPALRVSLKQQLNARLARVVGAHADGWPLAQVIVGFGAMIGSALIAPIVDVYATPDGVAALLNGMPPRDVANDSTPPGPVRVPKAGNAVPPAAPASGTPGTVASGTPTANSQPQTSAGYRSINEFVVSYRRDVNGTPYSTIFHRTGLFSWQLVGIDLSRE
jgi:hypothetical protein